MKKQSHTPGPWRAIPLKDNGSVYSYAVKSGDDYIFIGGVASVTEENANLIAAAPEMLEALEHIAEHITRLNQGLEPLSKADLTKILIFTVSPVIKKAKGEL